jgi:hypothetical protein
LAAAFDSAKTAAGRAVAIATEPARDPETFDFGAA